MSTIPSVSSAPSAPTTIVSISGSLGIGKTTFIQHLKEVAPDTVYILEPVDQWLHLTDPRTGENLLDRFYRDKQRWSYTFQNVAFITRLNLLMEALEHHPARIVIDGCLAVDQNVYGQMLSDDGMIDPMEWQAYNLWSRFYHQHINQHQIHYVYLRADPEVILERVNKRKRPEETQMELSYLVRLRGYLDRWAQEKDPTTITTYDLNCEVNSPEYQAIVTEVSQKLRN